MKNSAIGTLIKVNFFLLASYFTFQLIGETGFPNFSYSHINLGTQGLLILKSTLATLVVMPARMVPKTLLRGFFTVDFCLIPAVCFCSISGVFLAEIAIVQLIVFFVFRSCSARSLEQRVF